MALEILLSLNLFTEMRGHMPQNALTRRKHVSEPPKPFDGLLCVLLVLKHCASLHGVGAINILECARVMVY